MFYCNIIYAALQHNTIFLVIFYQIYFAEFVLYKYCMRKKYALGILYQDVSWRMGEWYNISWVPDADYIYNMDQLRHDPRIKILIIPMFNPGGPFPVQADYSWVDLIIGVTSEPSDYSLSVAQDAVNNQNVIFIAGGQAKDSGDASRTYSPMIYWVSQTFENNNYVPTVLPSQKPYQFDALLGSNKPSRMYVFYKLFDSGLLEKSLVSIWRQHQDFAPKDFDRHLYRGNLTNDFAKKYGTLDGRINFYRSPALDQLELSGVSYPKDDPPDYMSMQPTTRKSRERPTDHLLQSQEIPTGIYDSSWYSIVVETMSRLVFITEKTGKALLAKRVFVLFSGQGSLKYLRSQGFQTFNGIIDESYDSEPSERRRFDLAWEQVELLSTLDPVDVYQRANSILEHNYNLLPTLKNEHLKIRDFVAQWLPQ